MRVGMIHLPKGLIGINRRVASNSLGWRLRKLKFRQKLIITGILMKIKSILPRAEHRQILPRQQQAPLRLGAIKMVGEDWMMTMLVGAMMSHLKTKITHPLKNLNVTLEVAQFKNPSKIPIKISRKTKMILTA